MNIDLMLKRRNVTIDKFRDAVATSTTVSGLLRSLGQFPSGSNFRWVYMMIAECGLNLDHHVGQAHWRGKTGEAQLGGKSYTADEVFVKNSTYLYTHGLKKKIRRHKLLPEKCEQCPITNEWQGKPISLQLDHRDGDPRNNTIENLRFLCPNCHSQTSTFAGRNSAMGKVKNAAVAER